MEKQIKRNIGLVWIASVILALLLFLQESKMSHVDQIDRNSYGKGTKTEVVEVIVGDELKDTVEIEVQERVYSEKELKTVFGKAMDELPEIILGENKSLDHVEENLNLVTTIPDQPIQVQWESSKQEIVNSRGEIQKENLSGQGDMVELRGFLTYGEEEALYLVNVRVYPKTLTQKEKLLENVKEAVASSEEQSREAETVKLPKKIEGRSLVWERKKEHKGIWILSLGVVASMLIWMQEKQKKQKELLQRERQMQIDYPEIVNRIALLVGAGLTVKNAWKKIVDQYQEQGVGKEKRFAYEEMANAVREMHGGITEAECYEHFGRRTGLPSYVKLGALLSQNLRKGTKGLTELLSGEANQAYEERRQTVKKRGEEVSTKLLLPMSMMLVVVLVIVIVPAFLSISL